MLIAHRITAKLGVKALRSAGIIVCMAALGPHWANGAVIHPVPSRATLPSVSPRVHHGLPLRRRAGLDTTAITSAMIAAGRKVFHGQGGCATCHGQQLEGTAIAPTLKAHAWKDAKGGEFDAIYAVITRGVPGTAMVSHPGGITNAAAAQVAAYVWAVSHGHLSP